MSALLLPQASVGLVFFMYRVGHKRVISSIDQLTDYQLFKCSGVAIINVIILRQPTNNFMHEATENFVELQPAGLSGRSQVNDLY
jgi:hypothetical protein